MELKKRERIETRDYAKRGEVSKSVLKSTTPKKWLVASAMGIATLFYANPRSMFGSIGVVFGCVSTAVFTPLGENLNALSTIGLFVSVLSFVTVFLIGGISIIRTIGINKKNDEEKENVKKLSKSDSKLMVIFAIIGLICICYFAAWEFGFSNNSYFYTTTNSGNVRAISAS